MGAPKYLYSHSYKISDRAKRIKKIKAAIFNRWFWAGFFCFCLFSSAVFFFFFSDSFTVKEIKVVGGEKVGQDAIRALVEKKIRYSLFGYNLRNIFLVDAASSAKSVSDEFLVVAGVDIEKKLPTKLIVKVFERKPAGTVCNLGKCFYFDEGGLVFEGAKENTPPVVKTDREITLGKQIFQSNYPKAITEIWSKADETENIGAVEIFVPAAGEKTILNTKGGWAAYFSLDNNIASQIRNLKVVLQENVPVSARANLEYVDLRYGNQVYYKFKGAASPVTPIITPNTNK